MSLPDVIIDVGFTTPTVAADLLVLGDPARGIIGTGKLGSADIWADITSRVRSWSVQRGDRSGDDPTPRYDPGTCTIELNDPDRSFDPENLAGPYVLAGVSQIEPMRRVRIRALWNGITNPIFYGLADDWQPTYVGSFWTYVTLTATDGMKVLAGTDRAEGVLVGADENSGARIGRILDAAGWPALDRSIATGDVTVQATTLGGNVLAQAQLVQDTELGEFYIDASGRSVFRNRRAVVTDTRSSTSQATFGDGGYPAEIPYADVKASTGKALANTVTAARVDGLEQTVQDTVAAARYLVQTFERTDLVMSSDDQALDWASLVLYRAANPRPRFTSIGFLNPRPDVEAGYWPQALGRQFGDRITVKRRPKGLPAGPLNANPYFETDVSDWTASGATSFVRSTAQAHTGTASGLLTPTGAASNTQIEASNVPVTPGMVLTPHAWVRCAVARTVDVGVFWYTAANAFISTSAAPTAVAATTWTELQTNVVAPATAGFARLMVRMTGTPPAGNTLHIDEATISVAPISRESLIRGVTHESDGAYWRTSWVLESADKYTFFTIGDATRGAFGAYGIA